MGLSQEDLKPYEGKYLSRLIFEIAGSEYDEIDEGQIVKVTETAIHLDSSRNVRVMEAGEFVEKPAKLLEIYPLSRIVVIEIDLEA